MKSCSTFPIEWVKSQKSHPPSWWNCVPVKWNHVCHLPSQCSVCSAIMKSCSSWVKSCSDWEDDVPCVLPSWNHVPLSHFQLSEWNLESECLEITLSWSAIPVFPVSCLCPSLCKHADSSPALLSWSFSTLGLCMFIIDRCVTLAVHIHHDHFSPWVAAHSASLHHHPSVLITNCSHYMAPSYDNLPCNDWLCALVLALLFIFCWSYRACALPYTLLAFPLAFSNVPSFFPLTAHFHRSTYYGFVICGSCWRSNDG